jgi:hypothetical protein
VEHQENTFIPHKFSTTLIILIHPLLVAFRRGCTSPLVSEGKPGKRSLDLEHLTIAIVIFVHTLYFKTNASFVEFYLTINTKTFSDLVRRA